MSEQVKPASEQKPVAWARKWHIDGEVPKKVVNENGRMAWPSKFKLHPVTETKCLPDDVALYTAPQPDYKAQRDALLDFANHIATVPQLSGTGWQEMAQMVVESVKGGE